jgi:hypothetical protein
VSTRWKRGQFSAAVDSGDPPRHLLNESIESLNARRAIKARGHFHSEAGRDEIPLSGDKRHRRNEQRESKDPGREHHCALTGSLLCPSNVPAESEHGDKRKYWRTQYSEREPTSRVPDRGAECHQNSDPRSWPLARTVGVVEISQLAIDPIPPRQADEQPGRPYRNRCEHQRIGVRSPERDHDVEQSVVCAMALAHEATAFDRITQSASRAEPWVNAIVPSAV